MIPGSAVGAAEGTNPTGPLDRPQGVFSLLRVHKSVVPRPVSSSVVHSVLV